MTYITEKTIWPAQNLQDSVKALIDLFYSLADQNKPGVGERYASEVFHPDGEMRGAQKAFRGSEEIKTCRNGAWEVIDSRRHAVNKVYVNDIDGRDLMIVGEVEMGLKNGKTVKGDFVARMIVDAISLKRGHPRLELSQVWADMSPLIEALKEN